MPSSQLESHLNNNAPLFNEAYSSAVQVLARETMPLLMHGSGDVLPSDVNAATAHLVASLTVQYIANLVDAALDSQQIMSEHRCHSQLQDFCLPPPAFPRSRLPSVPPLPSILAASNTALSRQSGRKRRAGDEYWDEPLPEPKIRSKSNGTNQTTRNNIIDGTPADEEWVGLAGVDFFENSRARAAYVRGPSAALTTQSFVFPICHDVYLYGRVMEVQAAKRSLLQPVLLDPVVMEMVRTEGAKPKTVKKKQQVKSSGNTSDPEDDEDELDNEEVDDDEGNKPVWPGLEGIRTMEDIGSVEHAEDFIF